MVKQSSAKAAQKKPVEISAIEEITEETPALTPAEQFAQWVRGRGGVCDIVGNVVEATISNVGVSINHEGKSLTAIMAQAAQNGLK